MDNNSRSYGTLEDCPPPRPWQLQVVAPRQRRRRFGIRIVCWSIVAIFVLLLSWGVVEVLLFLYSLNEWGIPFRGPEPPHPDYSDETFAVGFDLGAGYGTATVSYYDGSFVEVGRVEGDGKYNEVLARLSLESSMHPTPPYYNRGQQADIPRQLERKFRKWLRHPASSDVAALVSVLSPLVDQANALLVSEGHLDGKGIHDKGKLKYAQLTIPHLPALYNEDLYDAADYLGIQIMMPFGFKSGDAAQYPITEINTAYAGMGLGLCRDWKARPPCEGFVPDIPASSRGSPNVLSVLYTDQALTVHVSPLSHAAYNFYSAGTSNFTAGLAKIPDYSDEDSYWTTVRKVIHDVLDSFWRGSTLDVVVVFGEHAKHETLQLILHEEVQGRGEVDWFVSDDTYAGSKGAAELIKRCMRLAGLKGNGYMNCIPDLRPRNQGW